MTRHNRRTLHRWMRWTLGLGALSLAVAGCASSSPQQTSSAKKDEASASASKEADDSKEKKETPSGPVLDPPEPLEFEDEAPEVEKLGQKDDVQAYEVGELKLIHKPTPANSVVSAKLYIEGGLANLSEKTAGVEKLALRTAVNGGTESTSKDAFSSTLDSVGSSVGYFTDRDYSGYTLRTVAKHFDTTWRLFEEAILEPAMPKSELKVQRQKQLAEIRTLSQNPNQLVSHISRKLIAEEHPYRLRHMGTSENVRAFRARDLTSHHHSILDPERMVLVVVGDIPVDDVVDKVKGRLARLEGSDWERPELDDFGVDERRLTTASKSLPTNYVLGRFAAPAPGHEDYPAMRVALAYLSDRLFEVVRTKRNLSYAVSAGIADHRVNGGYLYVSAKQPNKTIQVMLDEVDELKQTELEPTQLKKTRNVFVTDYYMDLETNSSQASALAQSEILHGDWREHLAFIDRIESVTPADVKRVANEYLRNYQFGVVGNPKQLDRSIFTGESAKRSKASPGDEATSEASSDGDSGDETS